jgi:hypothetical protein
MFNPREGWAMVQTAQLDEETDVIGNGFLSILASARNMPTVRKMVPQISLFIVPKLADPRSKRNVIHDLASLALIRLPREAGAT